MNKLRLCFISALIVSGCAQGQLADPVVTQDERSTFEVADAGPPTALARDQVGVVSIAERSCDAWSCQIDEVCIGKGQLNPINPCQVCDPLQSRTRWSSRPDGVYCDDKRWCTGFSACSLGLCVGEPHCPENTFCSEPRRQCLPR